VANEGRDGSVRTEAGHDVHVIGQDCDFVHVHVQATRGVPHRIDHVLGIRVPDAARSKSRVPSDVGVDAEGFVCHLGNG